MPGEIYNEIVDKLTPNVVCLSAAEGSKIEQLLGMYVECPGATIDWEKYSNNRRFDQSAEIVPILENFLGENFTDTIYLSAEYLPFIIKGSLRIIATTRYYRLGPLWLWSPSEGFIIEERHFDYKTVGLVTKTEDPFEKFELKKDSFCNGTFSYRFYLNNLISCFGVKMIDSFIETGKILPALQKITPLTNWGRIDWEQIEKKMVLGEDPTKIIPALEKLTDNTIDQTVYVEWCDADLPLISGDLALLLTHCRELTAMSLETIIFNLTTPYIIEISISGTITVGLLTGNNT